MTGKIRLPWFVARGILDVIPVRGNRAWNFDRFDSDLVEKSVQKRCLFFEKNARQRHTWLLYLRA